MTHFEPIVGYANMLRGYNETLCTVKVHLFFSRRVLNHTLLRENDNLSRSERRDGQDYKEIL